MEEDIHGLSSSGKVSDDESSKQHLDSIAMETLEQGDGLQPTGQGHIEGGPEQPIASACPSVLVHDLTLGRSDIEGSIEGQCQVIDILPSQDDASVKSYKDKLKDLLKLQQYVQTLMVVARFLYIATLALADDINFITRAQELLFTCLKLCDTSMLMVQNFHSSSNEILEKLKIAYLYLLDGFEDFARADVEATKGNIDSMQKAVEKTKGCLDTLKANTNDLKRDLGVHLSSLKEGAILDEPDGDRASGSSPAVLRSLSDVDGEHKRYGRDVGSEEVTIIIGAYFPRTVLIINSIALCTAAFQIINMFEPYIDDIDGVYPPMTITIFVCMWVLILFFDIFIILTPVATASTQPGELRVKPHVLWVLFALAGLTILLSYLQILDCYFKWWIRSSHHLILFVPIVVILLVIEFIVLKLHNTWVQQSNNTYTENLHDGRDGETNTRTVPYSKYCNDGQDGEHQTRTAKRQREAKQTFGRMKLAEVVYTEAIENLQMALGVLDNVTPLVEEWMKECEAVLEPALNRGIKAAESLTPAEKKAYWNSIVFKEAVVGYYCRWRALEVYAEEVKPKLRSTRRQIEQLYTENIRPREAVLKAWKIAAEEPHPEIRDIVENFSGLATFGVLHET